MIYLERQDVPALEKALSEYTSVEATGTKGLGQIVKEWKVGEWYEADFCSKQSWIDNDSGLHLMRD